MYLISLLVLFIIIFIVYTLNLNINKGEQNISPSPVYKIYNNQNNEQYENNDKIKHIDSEQPLMQEASTETSFITPPTILKKLNLTTEEYSQFLKDYESFTNSTFTKGNSSSLLKNIITQMSIDIDKEGLYIVMSQYTRGKKIQTTNIPQLIRIAICIISKRKLVTIFEKKNELDKRFDINNTIKEEFRNLRLSSLDAHIIRNCTLDFLNKTQCVLDINSYNKILKYLVRGYGIITKSQTIDDIIHLSTDECQLKELKQYGFIEFDQNIKQWIPSIKTKLYTVLRYNIPGDFIEYPTNLPEILHELEKDGYIKYSLNGIEFTDKCIDIKTNPDYDDLYNDIVTFVKSTNISCDDYDLYVQNIFLDLHSFLKKICGNLSKDDYNTLIVNISTAFTML